MKLLLDTHLLLWAVNMEMKPDEMPHAAGALIDDLENTVFFSVASIWEVTIKSGLKRGDFTVDPHVFRRTLLDSGYVQVPISSEHALAVGALPPRHKDPFDRILIAQATVEGFLLLTSDPIVAAYPGPIRKV